MEVLRGSDYKLGIEEVQDGGRAYYSGNINFNDFAEAREDSVRWN